MQEENWYSLEVQDLYRALGTTPELGLDTK